MCRVVRLAHTRMGLSTIGSRWRDSRDDTVWERGGTCGKSLDFLSFFLREKVDQQRKLGERGKRKRRYSRSKQRVAHGAREGQGGRRDFETTRARGWLAGRHWLRAALMMDSMVSRYTDGLRACLDFGLSRG